ncbi:MAG: zinc ribbon domain-containing protein [Candidatus Hodarchaeales archaeon]
MHHHHKSTLQSLISGLGVILLLIGLFTDTYDFGVGLILGMICWVISGAIGSYSQESRVKTNRNIDYRNPRGSYDVEKPQQKVRVIYCRTCGTRIDDDSIFCPQCGTRIN